MSGEMEAPYVYEDLEGEESQSQNKTAEKKPRKRWLVPVSVVAVGLFGIVCFGAGFAVAYFAVPCAGKCAFSKILFFSQMWPGYTLLGHIPPQCKTIKKTRFFGEEGGSGAIWTPCLFIKEQYVILFILNDSNNATLMNLDRCVYSVYVSINFKFSESILRSFTRLLSSFVGDFGDFKQLQIIQESTAMRGG